MTDLLWPIFEFRYMPDLAGRHGVLRYNKGSWKADDGSNDLAFIWNKHAIAIQLPARRNVVWSWVDAHWEVADPRHARINGHPRHYALRDGATEWGNYWGREQHPNERAAMAAESMARDLWGEAYRITIDFAPAAAHMRLGLVRTREGHETVKLPEDASCFMCGDRFRPDKQYGIGRPFRMPIP
jgi:hypothetical protein